MGRWKDARASAATWAGEKNRGLQTLLEERSALAESTQTTRLTVLRASEDASEIDGAGCWATWPRREVRVLLLVDEQTGYSFAIGRTVMVPVFVMRYSSIATSFPASLPYPDCLMPPNGDSAAEELPGVCQSCHVFSRFADIPVFMPTMPASSLSSSLHVLLASLVKKYDAKPIEVSFAIWTASSSVSKRYSPRSGPKISSCVVNIDAVMPEMMVGEKKLPGR